MGAKKKVKITQEMLRAGIKALGGWGPDTGMGIAFESNEDLIARIYNAMENAKTDSEAEEEKALCGMPDRGTLYRAPAPPQPDNPPATGATREETR
jgi:hypothetical protein